MKKAMLLIQRCREEGMDLSPADGVLKIVSSKPPSEALIQALKKAKSEVIAELNRQNNEYLNPWVLDQWRQASIPEWRSRFKRSVQEGDILLRKYAEWMLGEVLQDEDFQGSDL